VLISRLLALCASTSLLAGGPPPQSPPTFKSSGATVSVYATVTDASHRLVPDLEACAFTIGDDHGIQPLTVFEHKVLPISVLVLLDTSESMRESITLLRDAARQFVAHLLPSDRVEFGAFNNKIRWVRPFTNNQKTLNLVLDYFNREMVDWGTALWPAIDEGLKELNRIDGRKVMLVFSDGENNVGKYNITIPARAVADDVMVYAITLKTEYEGIRGRTKSVLDPGLPKLAEATGGGYTELTNTDDLAATFARVADELHHQYTLGFEAPVLDGKAHSITIQVKGEGYSVRARRSYLASRPK
jgi:VWFA-related protein